MTIPSRREAARLLSSLEPPAWFVRHACAVADVAGWLAHRSRARGLPVDVRLVEVAALLHDVDKLPDAGAPAGLRHGDGSAAWLEARGMAELAPVARGHPVTRLAEATFPDWLRTASPEALIVAYADKRAGQRLEPMDARFASWRRRYPGGPVDDVPGRAPGSAAGDARRARPHDAAVGEPPRGRGWDAEIASLVEARARALEAAVCAAAGVSPHDVSRLRWSRRALRAVAG